MFAYSLQDSEIALEKDEAVLSKSVLYNFHLKSGEHDVAEWMAVLQNEKLYVEVPQGDIPPGAKEWYLKLFVCVLHSSG